MTTATASIASRLRGIVAADRVLDDPDALVPYAYDASFWSLRSRRMPDAGVVPAQGGIVISFARMRRVHEIDRTNLQCVTEPGIVYADLNAALTGHGLFFPPDPGSGRACTIGGMAANNASGPHAV